MPIANYTASEIASLIPGAKRNGDGYRAPCPVHHGDGPNLSIIDSPDGAVVTCFSHDCDINSLVKSLNLEDRRNGNGRGHKVASPTPKAPKERKIVYAKPNEIAYDYGLNGKMTYQSVRCPHKDGGKHFYQRQPHPEIPNAFFKDTNGVKKVLYHAHSALRADS